jgi:hypothetical protein
MDVSTLMVALIVVWLQLTPLKGAKNEYSTTVGVKRLRMAMVATSSAS